MRNGAILTGILLLVIAQSAHAQTTRPATSQPMPANQKLDQMLRPMPGTSGGAKPLLPEPGPAPVDASTGAAAVAPGAVQLNVIREGTFLVDRIGRLTRSADGQNWEFTFEADGQAMKDPPVIILPNLKLMSMEDAVNSGNRDLRFRVTGQVTEYKGRNYILLEKVSVVQEKAQQF